MGEASEEGAGVEVGHDGDVSRDAEFARAPDAHDVASDEWVGADVHAADSADAPGGGFGVRFKGPGEAAWGAGEGRYVGGAAGEGLVASHATEGRVDEVESGLGLGAAVHVRLCEHEVEVGTYGVCESEGSEASDVRFSTVERR